MQTNRPDDSIVHVHRRRDGLKAASILERSRAGSRVLSAPTSVDINITNRCDLKCGFCSATPFHYATKEEELSLPELQMLFDAIEASGVFLVRIAGGEPLVREDLPEILRMLAGYSFGKVLLTNGLRLTPQVCEHLAAARFDAVAISVDSHLAHQHDQARGRAGAHARTLFNLPNLERCGLKFGAMTTVTSSNVVHMVEIADFLQRHGFRSVNFILLNASGLAAGTPGSFASFRVWSEQLLRLTNWIEDTRPAIAVRILPPHEDGVPYELYVPLRDAGRLDALRNVWKIDPQPRRRRELSCAAGHSQMTVYENGDVYGCDLMRDDPRWKAGNIRQQPLMNIWRESSAFRLLRGMAYPDLEGPCAACANQHCGGGCRASAANLTDSLFGSDINCGIHRNGSGDAADRHGHGHGATKGA